MKKMNSKYVSPGYDIKQYLLVGSLDLGNEEYCFPTFTSMYNKRGSVASKHKVIVDGLMCH